MIVIDIETAPRPDLVDRYLKPFPDFDPAAVKYGNTKDPALRAAKLEEERQKHEQAALDYRQKAHERAALDPVTAEIVAVGFMDAEELKAEILTRVEIKSEAALLEAVWKRFLDHSEAGTPWVFWSGNGSSTENFDADMLIRRSWILGVKVPARVFNGRFLSDRMVDATSRYLLGRREAFCSLTDAADQLGLYDPTLGLGLHLKDKERDIVTGQNFHLFLAGKADVDLPPEAQKALALAYLKNDLLTLAAIAQRIL